MDDLKVSVAMCTFNGEKYIEKQLSSIIHQSRLVDEIIICDDGSSDNTVSICTEILNDAKISSKIIVNEKPLNVVKNFSKCYSLCSGDIIFSSDQDDIWDYYKVERFLNTFQKYETINLIASNATIIDENDVSNQLTLKDAVDFQIPQKQTDWFYLLIKKTCITGATMAFRKDFFINYMYESEFWLHDAWLAMMAALNDSLYYIDEFLIKYRIHAHNACGLGNMNILKTALRSPFYFEDLYFQNYLAFSEFKKFVENNQLFSNKYLKDLDKCISFWHERSNLRNLKFIELLKMTKKNKNKGAYDDYTQGKIYFYLDRYFWLIYKLIPRKKRKRACNNSQ